MPIYRIYTIPVGGTRRPATEVEFAIPELAVRFARELSRVGATVEVWAGSDLIKEIPPPADYKPLTRRVLD